MLKLKYFLKCSPNSTSNLQITNLLAIAFIMNSGTGKVKGVTLSTSEGSSDPFCLISSPFHYKRSNSLLNSPIINTCLTVSVPSLHEPYYVGNVSTSPISECTLLKVELSNLIEI